MKNGILETHCQHGLGGGGGARLETGKHFGNGAHFLGAGRLGDRRAPVLTDVATAIAIGGIGIVAHDGDGCLTDLL